jgi:preprotein translocase subunit SecG
MQTVLIVIHLLIVLALVGVVLLQRSEGGGLGMGGGGGSAGVQGLMTGRGQANALTRATAILAAGFFCTSLALSVLATQGRPQGSVLDRAAPAGSSQPGTPAPPSAGGVLDQLRQIEGGARPPQPPAN